MKAKIGRGSGFRGVLDYVLGKGDGHVVGGLMAGNTARELASEFGSVRRLRPDVKRPVWHCSLTLPKDEQLTDDDWDTIATDFMGRMEFSDDTPWLAVRHNDTDHDHIHIVASRVNLSGEVWHGKWEARRAIQATQVLERFYCLERTPGLEKSKPEKSLSKQEIEMAIRTQKEPPKQALQRLVKEAAADGPTALQFAERLVMAGVGVRANIAGTGRLSGFSFEYDGVAFKASQLGKGFGWPALQRDYGVTYEQDRDREGLKRLSEQPEDNPGLENVIERAEQRKREFEQREPEINSESGELSDSVPEDEGVRDRSQRQEQGNGRPDKQFAPRKQKLGEIRDRVLGFIRSAADLFGNLRGSRGADELDSTEADVKTEKKISPEQEKSEKFFKDLRDMKPEKRVIQGAKERVRELKNADSQRLSDYESELKNRPKSPSPASSGRDREF